MAFVDTVPIIRLWEALDRLAIPGTLITAIKQLYKDNSGHIKSGNRTISSFKILKGLLQECPTSLTLLKLCLENSLRPWKQKCKDKGMNDRIEYLHILCFDDDQVVIFQDEEDLSNMVRKLQEQNQKADLEINLKKTEFLTTTEEDVIKS